MDKTILLATPTMHGEEMEYIQEAFDRNWITPLGFNCDAFEQELASYLGDGHAERHLLSLSSGTAALHLALKLSGITPGERVLCSDLTFIASVNPVLYEGGRPVFIDSETETWNMSPESLELAFRRYPLARLVVLAHLYGTPAKLDEIRAICRDHDALLIEDAAESLSSMYKGRQTGNFGDVAALSFNGNKIITTSGGGALVCREAEDREAALFYATQAKEKAPWYQHEQIGFNCRLSNVSAGIGRGQLLHLEEHRTLKEKIYHRYEEGFRKAKLPVKMNPYLADSRPNFWLSCLTVDPEALCPCKRWDDTSKWEHVPGKTCPDEIASVLAAQNVQTRPIWKPMHMQPVFRGYDLVSAAPEADQGYEPAGSVSEDIFARGICLPSDIKMTEEEQDYVISLICGCFE